MKTPQTVRQPAGGRDYYRLVRDPDFEERVSQAAEQAVLAMDALVANEHKLHYVTYVFARTLNDVSQWLVQPELPN